MKLHIFWHLCTIFKFRKRSKEIIQRQWKKINDSGLINFCEKIHIVIIGRTDYNILLNILRHPKVVLEKVACRGNEFVSSSLIYNFSKIEENKDKLILYIHNKGVTRDNKLKLKVDSWTECLEYFLIEKHLRCINKFKEDNNINTIGCLKKAFIYCGNFWYAKTNYISSLISPAENMNKVQDNLKKYYASEYWILSKLNNITNISIYQYKNFEAYKTILFRKDYENKFLF